MFFYELDVFIDVYRWYKQQIILKNLVVKSEAIVNENQVLLQY